MQAAHIDKQETQAERRKKKQSVKPEKVRTVGRCRFHVPWILFDGVDEGEELKSVDFVIFDATDIFCHNFEPPVVGSSVAMAPSFA